MAKIYSAPSTIKEPNFELLIKGNGNNAYKADIERYEREVAEFCKQTGDPLAGKIIRFGVADGYAQYMVYKSKPLSLIHLRIGDGYRLQSFMERGLRLADVKQRIQRDEAWSKLFTKKATA